MMKWPLYLCLTLGLWLSGLQTACAQNDASFWADGQRMGGNSFLERPPSEAYFKAFSDYGGEWIRLSWTKWDSASEGAFLIGDPSEYSGLVEGDLLTLKRVIKAAKTHNVKIVLTPLSLPGSVWTQHNGDKIDDRIYTDKAYWDQAAKFWVDLATEFKDEPVIVAYNLLNEPAPERAAGYESGSREANIDWYAKHAGTARDLPGFYNHIIKAVRRVDPKTPIMVDGGFYGNPNGFDYFPAPLNDQNILYAFHMYQPWAATSVWNTQNGSKLVYPGEMEIWGRKQLWDADRVAKTIAQTIDWADEHGIPPSQVVMSEFGCMRYLEWCPAYLEDVLKTADSNDLHWAFYTFRSDNWGGMDYELGQARPAHGTNGVSVQRFWDLSERNRLDEIPRKDTPAFNPISRRLKQNRKPHSD